MLKLYVYQKKKNLNFLSIRSEYLICLLYMHKITYKFPYGKISKWRQLKKT